MVISYDTRVDGSGTDHVYRLNDGSWWLLASSDYFAARRPRIVPDQSQHEHGGQAQLQSHGLVLLLI